nr:unnamed protein product [Rangifer tarandus platyrhynchus]
MGHDSPHGPQEKGCPWWMIPPRRSRADGCGDLHTHVVHALLHQPEHLLKLPLEGLQEFLQDTLARALEDEACPCSCRPPWLSYPGWIPAWATPRVTQQPDPVTPLRPQQPAPPSLLKMAPMGPGRPLCPEAAAASIPSMKVTSTAMMEPGQYPKSCAKAPHIRMTP